MLPVVIYSFQCLKFPVFWERRLPLAAMKLDILFRLLVAVLWLHDGWRWTMVRLHVVVPPIVLFHRPVAAGHGQRRA